MKSNYARGFCLATALGLILGGGVAQAADSSPDIPLEFGSATALPVPATRFDGKIMDNKMYVLGFRLSDNSTDGSIWYYDVKTDEWVDTGTDMAVPVSNYKIVTLTDDMGRGLYVFGGRTNDGETSTTVQVYYPRTDTTRVIESDPWPGTTPSECVSLPATGVSVVEGKAYVMGGMSFSTSIPACVDDNSDQVWSYDPMAAEGDKWSQEPSLNLARGYVATAVIGDRIYAMGGDVNDVGTLTATPMVESWQVGSDSWNDEDYADLPMGCDETQVFKFKNGNLGGTINLAGCGQWPNALPDVLQYDVAGDSWTTVGAMLEARRNHAGANIGTATEPRLFVVGGYSADGATTLQSSEIGQRASVPFTGGSGSSPLAPPSGVTIPLF